MYRVFQKMMSKMMAEQAKAGPKKAASKSKVKKKLMKKPVKISKQKVQRDSTSEDSKSAEEVSEEEEQLIYIPKHLRSSKRPVEEPLSVNKPKYGAPVEDSIQALTENSQGLTDSGQREKVIHQTGFLSRLGRGQQSGEPPPEIH